MRSSGKMNQRDPMRRMNARYLKWTAYGLLILLCAILQSIPHPLYEIGGAKPLLLIPVVVFIAMYTGPVGGAAAGVAAGLLWDVYSDRLMGFNALLLLMIGCACGLIVRVLMRNNLLSAALLATGAVVVQCLLDWLLNFVIWGTHEAGLVLVYYVVPELVYTLVLVPLLYWITTGVARLLKNRE